MSNQVGAKVQETGICEPCGSDGAVKLFEARDRLKPAGEAFPVLKCRNCGILRTLPILSDSELSKYYPSGYWGETPSQEQINRSQSEKITFLDGCVGLNGGRILDVGCGAGFFLRALKKDVWDRYGVEISGEATEIACKSLGNDRVKKGRLHDSNFPDNYFDVVAFWSSLEHTNEPKSHLLEAKRILKRNGTLIVQLPNVESYQAGLFKEKWFSLDVPRHRCHFTEPALRMLLEGIGFSVYRTSFQSKAHNAHALRQSLKSLLFEGSYFRKSVYLLIKPFTTPFDYLMSLTRKGATLTLAARKF